MKKIAVMTVVMMIAAMAIAVMTRKKEKSHYKVSMGGEGGSKENKTVEKYEEANHESSIFLALSKWKLLNSQSV